MKYLALLLISLLIGCDKNTAKLSKCDSDLKCSTLAYFKTSNECQKYQKALSAKFPYIYVCEEL